MSLDKILLIFIFYIGITLTYRPSKQQENKQIVGPISSKKGTKKGLSHCGDNPKSGAIKELLSNLLIGILDSTIRLVKKGLTMAK